MILFVASVLFLKVLCLIDGDAKDEEDARSTKDILFDDVLCVLCYPPTCLSCEENDSSIRFSRDGKKEKTKEKDGDGEKKKKKSSKADDDGEKKKKKKKSKD